MTFVARDMSIIKTGKSMNCLYSAFTSAALLALGSAAVAQENELVSESIDAFVEECGAAISEPSDYYKSARSQGQGGPVAVARVPDNEIFWILNMLSPRELYVHLGEISQQTRVYCSMSLFNVPEVRDPAATNEAFLAWAETSEGIERTGGPVDLKALMAGDEGTTGGQVEMTAQIYQHLLKGWSDTDAIAVVAIQTGMLELSTEVMLPSVLEIED